MPYDFELISERKIKEIDSIARLYVHRTGAQLLSVSNNDENKVFGITFRTPPSDSKGTPHILEHSVLCGSRKYPLKEPFVELLKGSMSTFLNAFTYPDKTCYPVASTNVKDFYNLIDVYLDAVFYPKLTEHTFKQEGWHYCLESIDSPLTIKGIVYSEMKGAYSSADILLEEYSMRSLFPDTVYRFDSGGDPDEIPNLTYEEFIAFHRRFYHPSNSFIWFYGDDDPEERLRYMGEFLKDFEKKKINADIPSQPPVSEVKYISKSFMAKDKEKGMITVNWLLPEGMDQKRRLSFTILEHILLGMPGSPLKKALIESGLGEDIAGVGLEKDIKQLFFSTGLKGVRIENMQKVEDLIMDTLKQLVKDGIAPETVEASVNTVEFRLRENNTGHFPRGLSLMLRALTFWIYGADPVSAIKFEDEINSIKDELKSRKKYFESMIEEYLIENKHRTVLMLKPDPELKEKKEKEEKERLQRIKSRMSVSELKKIMEEEKELRKIQQRPDPKEALQKIPVLRLENIEKEEREIPIEISKRNGAEIIFHDIFTSDIFYLDVGFDFHSLKKELIPYIPLIGKALIELGTKKRDFIGLSQRIGQKTGGIRPHLFIHQIINSNTCTAKLFLRAKALKKNVPDMIDILKEILLFPEFKNKDRLKQIILEEKARYEKELIPSGHEFLKTRIFSHFSESGWASELTGGISYLLFLRNLIKKDFESILKDIFEAYETILNRTSLVVNITCPQKDFISYEKHIYELLDAIPEKKKTYVSWQKGDFTEFEAISINSHVNFVGKGANLYDLGYKFHGSSLVIKNYLRNTWLWNKIRVEGGAYGAFCIFDRFTGSLCFVSYRDPNIAETIDVFDRCSDFLKEIEVDKRELQKGIIRTIADIDRPLLPDAKGFTSMKYYLTENTKEARKRMREEILATKQDHFKQFAEILNNVKEKGIIKIIASREKIESFSKKMHIVEI